MQGSDRFWFSGEELTNLVNEHSIQFMWGVLSGFLPEEKINLKNLDVLPYADGNPKFWSSHPSIQHHKAKVRDICWDSTCMLLLSKEEKIIKNFIKNFPSAEILENIIAAINKRQ